MADQQTREECMDVVIDSLSRYQGTYKMLSIRTGLSVGCIGDIATGKTAWPRHKTLWILIDILELKLTIHRRN